MERLVIVIDCPDDYRMRLVPDLVAKQIESQLGYVNTSGAPVVRVRWQSMDAGAL